MNKKRRKKFRVIVTIEYLFVTQTCVVSWIVLCCSFIINQEYKSLLKIEKKPNLTLDSLSLLSRWLFPWFSRIFPRQLVMTTGGKKRKRRSFPSSIVFNCGYLAKSLFSSNGYSKESQHFWQYFGKNTL